MAFVANLTDEEQQNQQNNPSQGPKAPGGSGGVRLAPSSSVVSGGAGGGTASSKPAGGQFATLNDYVTANTPNAEGLANQVVAPIQQQAQDTGKQVTQTLSDAQNAINSGYTPQNNDLISQASANPVSFSNDPNNVTQFQAQLNDTYTGPQSVESMAPYQTLLGNINNTISTGQSLTNNTAGQEQLLKNVETNPDNAGVTNLNEAILSQNPDYLSKVTNSYQPFSDLLGTLQTGAAGIDPSVQTATANAKAAADAAKGVIDTGVTNLNNTVNSEFANAGQNVAAYNTDVNTLQGAAKAYNTDIQNFLADPTNAQYVQNPGSSSPLQSWLDLQQFTGSPTVANSATAQDYAQAQALQTLEGNGTTLGTVISPTTATQEGTSLPANYQSILDALNNQDVVKAMQSEVGGFGNEIQQSVAPFTSAQAQSDSGRSTFSSIAGNSNIYNPITAQSNPTLTDPATGKSVPAMITQTAHVNGQKTDTTQQVPNPAWQALQQQAMDASKLAQQGDSARTAAAQGIQNAPTAATNYNNLIAKLQADLSPISGLNIPAIQTNGTGGNNDLSTLKDAGLASGVATIPTLGAMAGNQIYKNLTQDNIGQILGSIGTLGLGSLVLSPDIVKGIGSAAQDALNSIGKFFGGLF